MTAWDWVSVSLLACAASCGLSYMILAWRWRVEERQAEPEQAPEDRPDYRRLLAEIRVCPECHGTYLAKAGFRTEQSCDPCVAKRFDEHVEAQKDWMRGQGWEDVE